MLRSPRKPSVGVGSIIAVGFALLLAIMATLASYVVAKPAIEKLQSRSWVRTTCEVTLADITAHHNDDSTTYWIAFLYELRVGNALYEGHRLDFNDDIHESREGVLEERYPVRGARVACWYDPEDPRRSVIERVGWPSVVGVLLIAMFVAAGAIIAYVGRKRFVRREVLPDGRARVSCRNARMPVLLFVAISTAMSAGMSWLAGATSPKGALAIVWWSITALIALWLVYLVCAFYTKVTISLASLELVPGQRVDAKWSISGPIKPRHVSMTVVGRARSKWSDGSQARIDLREFHKADLETARMPRNALPSLDIGPNTITWVIVVTAYIPWWPDIAIEIPLVVRGKAGAARDYQDPLAMPAGKEPIALLLDGDRKQYAPGDTIAGTIAWTRGSPPAGAHVQLRWTSESPNVTHTEVVGEVSVAELPRFVTPDAADPYRGTAPSEEPGGPLEAVEVRRLRFVAPDAPYSSKGPIFKVRWSLKLALDVGKQYETATVELAIHGREHARDRDGDDD